MHISVPPWIRHKENLESTFPGVEIYRYKGMWQELQQLEVRVELTMLIIQSSLIMIQVYLLLNNY